MAQAYAEKLYESVPYFEINVVFTFNWRISFAGHQFLDMRNGHVKMLKHNKLVKNMECEITVTGLTSEAAGVGRYNGFTIFVPGALPGEVVKVRLIKITSSYAVGKLLEICSDPSPNRIVPSCPAFPHCGGCDLFHLSYDAQLDFKRQIVYDALTRIGGLERPVVFQCLPADEIFSYRNKCALPVGLHENSPSIGFYRPRSHDIIQCDSCRIQAPYVQMLISTVKDWMHTFHIPPYDETANRGILRHIIARHAEDSGEKMIIIVTAQEKLPHADMLVSTIRKKISGVVSIMQNINPGRTNVIMSDHNRLLYGNSWLDDSIAEIKCRISPQSFLQIHTKQAERLYRKVVEFCALTGKETVFDAYCGIGIMSLMLAKAAQTVTGVEIVPQAVENAVENAHRNQMTNVRFLCGPCEEIFPSLVRKGARADVLVVDPPRKGCAPEFLACIPQIHPQKIIYVSCHPGTLARDLRVLTQKGYLFRQALPVDMFPHTKHVETIVLLQRETL